MIRLFTVVGARPQFIKAAAVSRAIRSGFSNQVKEFIVHTGQHYDDEMSDVFFRELEIPTPAYHLSIGSTKHGLMTANMLAGLEEVFAKGKPDVVLVFGDTNSTLAGGLAAAKMKIPVAHVEAGLRSFKKAMPEEINRCLTDHLSTFLFPPTPLAFHNLQIEGLQMDLRKQVSIDNPFVQNPGDVMLDNALYFGNKSGSGDKLLTDQNLRDRKFALVTVHRDFNTENSNRFNSIFSGLLKLADNSDMRLFFPMHPRTLQALDRDEFADLKKEIENHPQIIIHPPVSYFETLSLLKECKVVITDSGGLQKEAYFFHKPCVILRNETEWKEIVETGSAICVDSDDTKIMQYAVHFSQRQHFSFPPLYGDGHAAEKIVKSLITHFQA